MKNENDLTTPYFDKPVPPTLDELESELKHVAMRLEAWEHIILRQLPSRRDKYEFLSVMGNLPDCLQHVSDAYKSLVDTVDWALHKTGEPVDPDFAETIQVMKSLPPVKKRWWERLSKIIGS